MDITEREFYNRHAAPKERGGKLNNKPEQPLSSPSKEQRNFPLSLSIPLLSWDPFLVL